MKTHTRAISAMHAYRLLVGLAGFAALALTLPRTALPPWTDALALLAISTCIKRLGFNVISGVTHSLVGIVDLAILFLFGGASAGLLAGLGAALARLVATGQDGDEAVLSRALASWYVGGLRALILVAVGALYRALGGEIPLGILTWVGFARVIASSIALFALDHAAWWLSAVLADGWSGGSEFLQRISTYSLFVELAPLPASVLLAEIYQLQSAPAVVVMLMALLAAGLMLRRLVAAREEERRRVRELSLMNSLTQDLLSAGPDPNAIYRLIYRYTSALAPVRGFAIQRPADTGSPDLVFAVVDGKERAFPNAGEGFFRTVELTRESILVADTGATTHCPLDLGFQAQGAICLPVEVGSDLLAVISLQHDRALAFAPNLLAPLEAMAAQAAQALRTAQIYASERERAAHLMAVAEVGRKVAAILDLEALFGDTVHLVQETFSYHCVSLFTVDSDAEQVEFRASSHPDVQERGVTIRWGTGIVGWAAARGEPVISNSVTDDERYLSDAALPSTRSEVAVPLKVEERILGVLDMQSDQVNAFGPDDLVALGTLGDLVAIAIEDSRLYQEGQEQAWVSTALLQVAESVAQANTPDDILDSVVRLAPMLTGVDRCLVFLWTEEKEAFELAQGSGIPPERMHALRGQLLSASEVPMLAAVQRTGERLQGPAQELRNAPWSLEGGPPDSEMIALPLRAFGKVIGVLVAEELDGRGLAWKHREAILAGAADYAGMALENAQLNASLREEAWASAALLQVATMIGASPDLEETLTTVVRLTPLLVSVGWCIVLLWDDESRRFTIAPSHNAPPEITQGIDERPSFLTETVLDPLVMANEPFEATVFDHSRPGSAGAERIGAFPLRTWDRLLGGLLVGGASPGQAAPEHRKGILAGIANQLTLAIESSRLQEQALEQERLQRSIELAREIQESFLPECCPEADGWDLAAEWRAARGVGGDFYDFIVLPDDRLGLVIADVSDKGVGAALYMALSRAVLRAAALTTSDPAETLRRANRVLMDDARSGMFVTVFYAIVSTRTGMMTYARAGHNPALLLRARSGEVIELRPSGVVLGILDEPALEAGSLQVQPGDVLLMYTDGVVEAVNEQQEEFGRERLTRALRGCADASAEDAMQRIDMAVQTFVAGQPPSDDITLIVMRRTPLLGPGERELS
jgi:phosphoserine phosphatase RsbU/P